jgi:DNA-binding MarR family transcriptional regulator
LVPKVTHSDYLALAAFRYEIRKFLAFSERAARHAGLEPQQHQLLLAVHGLPAGVRPTIRAAAERLCVKHHTTVALVDKLEAQGMLARERSQQDRREVWLLLTDAGRATLQALSELHREQLQSVGPSMVSALGAILGEQRRSARPKRAARAEPRAARRPARSATTRAVR